MNWVEWTKGICHKWSRGRLISPSLPGDRYLKLSSLKRSPGRNLGEHRLVRRSGTTSRGIALLVFSLRMRSFPKTELLKRCHTPFPVNRISERKINTSNVIAKRRILNSISVRNEMVKIPYEVVNSAAVSWPSYADKVLRNSPHEAVRIFIKHIWHWVWLSALAFLTCGADLRR